MRQPPYILDLVEAAPDEWSHPADAAKVAAARPALPDLNKATRPRTVEDIPVLGDGAQGFAFLAALVVIVVLKRALIG